MTKRTITALALTLPCILLMAGVVWAMSSTNYRLDWFTPLTSSGGGAASSTNYAVNFTVGQTAIYASSSANYKVRMGYWFGATGASGARHEIYLPLILRNF